MNERIAKLRRILASFEIAQRDRQRVDRLFYACHASLAELLAEIDAEINPPPPDHLPLDPDEMDAILRESPLYAGRTE